MPVRSDMVDSVMNSPRGARLLSAERRANTAHFHENGGSGGYHYVRTDHRRLSVITTTNAAV